MKKSGTVPLTLVDHIASLAHLSVDEKDKKALAKQLSDILDLVNKLQSADTKNVPPTSQVTGLENVFRDDVVTASFTQEEALANAPRQWNGFFVVDAIFE